MPTILRRLDLPVNARESVIADCASNAADRPAWPQPDAAGELLGQLRLSGIVYCRSELTAPWGLTMPPMPGCMSFHLVIEGAALLCDAGGATQLLSAGDVALLTAGGGHALRSSAGVPVPDLFSLPRRSLSPWFEWLHHGGGGAATTLVCGAVRFDDAVSLRLVGALPPVVLLRSTQRGENDSLALVLKLLAAEAARPGPGAEALLTRLADIVVVQVLREWLASQPPQQQGWVAALQDRHIGRALQRLHADPARAWTLPALAAESGLSRSALAERFQRLVGCAPMSYLTALRVLKGRELLTLGGLSVAEVAERCGYASDAAFSRTFKRLTGLSPGQVRRGVHQLQRGHVLRVPLGLGEQAAGDHGATRRQR